MRKENNFQIAKVQRQGVALFLLDFFQFQPGVAYKSVAYKKKACTSAGKYKMRPPTHRLNLFHIFRTYIGSG